jgi:hypothetical protein
MSWISGNCQDDRNYSCYYQSFGEWVCGPDGFCEFVVESWCVDSDEPCQSINNGGGLVKVADHRPPPGGDSGGGGW